jgi:hypothetical protein
MASPPVKNGMGQRYLVSVWVPATRGALADIPIALMAASIVVAIVVMIVASVRLSIRAEQ